MALIVGTPPDQGMTVMSPCGKEVGSNKVGGDVLVGKVWAEGAEFFDEAGFGADVGIEA
jgi:hypothetical protein